ncbi:MAG TPA: alpha/beta hydrolase family protein [Candidatus Acidoferrales bacterium]|nr:alpha/beta hydrolase family protein [Candidatus Acidoferrales bacterium]
MNERRRAALALVALLCFAAAGQAATGRAECRTVPSRILHRAVPYCILLPPSYDAEKTRRYPVLYFLHGLGDNEQMFLRSGALDLVEDAWERGGIGEYLIATPRGGASFYINSRDGRERYEDFLLREFLPFIERNYRTQPGRRYRGIGGISMGGYGALHLAFRHPEMFGAVSASSAALIEEPPRITTPGAQQSPVMRLLAGVFGSPLDRAFWDRNNPLRLARTAAIAGLGIYFDCGEQDDYGFERGAAALDEILTSRRIPHEFHLYPGGHNWGYFAQHLSASLEFYSRAFGLGSAQGQKKR